MSRFPILACLLSAVLAGPATAGAPPQSEADAPTAPLRIDARTRSVLDAGLQRHGQTRVIVGLRSASPGDQTAAAELAARVPGSAASRATVARLQDGVLGALRDPRGVRRYRNFAYLSLEVDAAGLERLLRLPEVMSVREDSLLTPHLDRSAPQIGADAAWAMGYRGAGQVVAVLDSGVDSAHSALAGKVVAEACFSTTATALSSSVCPAGTNPGGADQQFGAGAARPCTINGCDHGTHVAGTAAGNDSLYTGVAPDALVFGVQVFSRFDDSTYCGSLGTPCILSFLSDLLAGLDWVYDQRGSYSIASANMSLGGGGYSIQAECDAYYPSLTSMISTLRSAGIAAAVSSGNSGYSNRIGHPGCISDAVSVGAVNASDGIASFSNSASWLDLLAPGTSIDAPVPGGGFGRKQGTSMAAPHVAGAFAILRSAGATGSVDDLLDALKSTGVPILDGRNQVTTPRIQVNEAVLELLGTGAGSADFVLIPGQLETGQYGNRWGNDQNEVEVVAAFQQSVTDLELSVTGHDIDYNDEISVYLNGARIGFLSKGPNNQLNAGDRFSIPAAAQQSGTNEITFRQRSPGWIWGVTNLLLETPAPPSPVGVDLVLAPGVQDNGRYGNRWGSDQNEVEVTAAFQRTGDDFALDVVGHDIDYNDEISVHLNGSQIGFLSKGPNNGLNGGDTFVIPASIQTAGENRVVFRQRSPGWIWGVTALLLTETSSAGSTSDLTLVPGVMDMGQYGWRWGDNAHRESLTAGFQSNGANFELQVTAYDMDRNDEIAVYLNGNRIGYLSRGPNNAFNAGNTFSIPATLQRPDDNEIEFRQRTPGWIWGVTRLLLTDTGN